MRLFIPVLAGAAVFAFAACGPADRVSEAPAPAPAPARDYDYALDRALIEDLLGRYAFAVDFNDAESYGATFAPDGVLIHAGGVEEGREAIIAFASDYTPAADDGARPSRWGHNIMNLVLEIDGDRAHGAAYWVQVTNETPDRQPRLGYFGHSEDEYVRIDGQWHFARREIFNEAFEPRAAAGGENPVRGLWTDRPAPASAMEEPAE